MTARSALLMGVMSPNPMVVIAVSDQYAAAKYISGPGMSSTYTKGVYVKHLALRAV